MFLSIVIGCFLLLRAWGLIVSFMTCGWRSQKNDEQQHMQGRRSSGAQRAEIEAGVGQNLSVFEHIEQGMTKNPDGLAVTCTFQSAGHLDELLVKPIDEEPRSQRTRDQGRFQTNSSYTSHVAEGLWQPQATKQGQKRRDVNGYREEKKSQPFVQELVPNGVKNVPTTKFENEKLVPASKSSSSSSSTAAAAEGVIPLTLTYRQLNQAAVRLARGLIATGTRPGATLLMLIPNGGEYAILLWTCVLLRITYVSLDPGLLDVTGFTKLKRLLKLLKAQVVVVPDGRAGKAAKVAFSELGLPVPIQISLGSPSSCCRDSDLGDDYDGGGSGGWKTLASIANTCVGYDDEFETALLTAARNDDRKRIHSIMFTSGTSGGLPKGCPMSVGGMSFMLHSQAWLMDDGAGDVALQQAHNSRGIAPAQTLQTWKAGGAVVMTGQGFSVPHAVQAIRSLGATFLVLTPPMVHEMAENNDNDNNMNIFVSIKRVQVGGDTVTTNLLRKTVVLFPPSTEICVNHGMTEGGGSFMWPRPFAQDTCRVPCYGDICPVGAVAPGSIIRVWDMDKKCVADRGQPGELHVSSPSIIGAYLGGASPESFYREGRTKKKRWFNTGDVAVMDPEGFVFILGRSKDMIRRAGVTVMPPAVESVIEEFTGSHVQAIVVALPHPVLGAEPFAVVSSLNGKTEAEVKAHVRRCLGKHYALGGIASLRQLGLAEIPLNPTRKVAKSEVEKAVMSYLRSRKSRTC